MQRSHSQTGGRNIPLSALGGGEGRGEGGGAGLNRIDIGHYGPDRCLTGFLGRQRGTLPMPWKETCVMDEKTAFIAECLRGELPMTALCERRYRLPIAGTVSGRGAWRVAAPLARAAPPWHDD